MRLKLSVILAAVLLGTFAPPVGAAGRCGDHPWCDTKLSPDTRAGLLLAALTEDERIGLLAGDELTGVAGGEGTHTGTSDGVERVGLPPVYFSDGPVGVRQGKATPMPIPMAVAASFDPRLARLHGATIATEARFKGNDVVYAPTVNILRTPLWGRAFETYGEDPFLTARTGVGWIRGAQSEGIIANVKHYAANNQEGGGEGGGIQIGESPVATPGPQGSRFYVNVVADERTLREIYLPQFEAAVKEANVGSVMCAYNRVNGDFACENAWLLRQVLQREWGFRGFVLADYGAAKDACSSLRNGLDFDPWPGIAYSPQNVRTCLVSGSASMADVDEHVRRILRTLFAYGFFDRPAHVDDDDQIDKPAHLRAAQRVEEGAIVLLRNRGMLPLRARRLKSIALIGADADRFKTGSGSAQVKPFSHITPRAAIERRVGESVEVRYDDGSDRERAVAVARGADVALVFASNTQKEFADNECLRLSCEDDEQDRLIEAVAEANPRTAAVLETGGPVLTPWRSKLNALVEAWYPGAAGGAAIARVLFGDIDPSGRLPATFPRSEADLPTAGDPEKYPGVGADVHYKEGVLVGYRWFDEKRLRPAYPFGFGLSYTRFRYGRLHVQRRGPTTVVVSLTVRNAGKRRGADVPQLYLGLPSPREGVVQPPRQLKGFRKVSLRPGQRKRVWFRIGARDLSYWDVEARGWRVAPGCYRVMVGRSSRNVLRRAALPVRGGRCG